MKPTHMNNIIWVPMPAKKALEIMDTAYQSNKSIEIAFRYFNLRFEQEMICYWVQQFMIITWEISKEDDITIISILLHPPKYEVGDRVMIIATGEIGEIEEVLDERLQGEYNLKVYGIKPQSSEFLYRAHRAQICKLPAIQKPSE